MLDLTGETLPTVPEPPSGAADCGPSRPVPRVQPLPYARPGIGRRDGRVAITAWGLLTWAYGREQVRMAGSGGRSEAAGLTWRATSATGAACDRLAGGVAGRGTINARASAHADAEAVDGWVRGRGREDYWLLVRAGESGETPDWNPPIAPGRLLPVLGVHGRPKMIVDREGKRVIGCWVEQVGVPAHEVAGMRAAARGRYAQLVALLGEMSGAVDNRLTRWCVEGIGMEAEPWRAFAA